MLAKTWKNEDLTNRFASEKMDGMRCLWDGGLSRGILKAQVPFANTAKDSRYKIEPVATGLWSRYGNVIHAPDWWLAQLPPIPLDGELYIPQHREETFSITKKLVPDDNEWRRVKFYIFDAPSYNSVLSDRDIKGTNFRKSLIGCLDWAKQLNDGLVMSWFSSKSPSWVYERIQSIANDVIVPLDQCKLTTNWREEIDVLLNKVSITKGEGIIIRDNVPWEPKRSKRLLKIKFEDDAEGIVIGYVGGKEGKTGDMVGKLGSLIVQWNSNIFNVGGMTQVERQLYTIDGKPADHIVKDYQGLAVQEQVVSKHFPIESRITFTYAGLTKNGIPQHAKLKRVRNYE